MDPVRALLTLHMTAGLGPQRIAALLESFGSAEAVLAAGSARLESLPGIGPKIAAALAATVAGDAAALELERAAKAGVQVVARGQPGYPAALADTPGAPYVLFLRGEITPGDARAVALVGTRHPTPQGRKVARQLAEGLAQAGVTIISGLPRFTGLGTSRSLRRKILPRSSTDFRRLVP
jgi:DNA processing protein